MEFSMIALIFSAIIVISSGAPAPKPKPAYIAAPLAAAPLVAPVAPLVPAPYVTATSSQVVARNYNALATPLAYSAPLVAAPAVVPSYPYALPYALPHHFGPVQPYLL